MLISCLLLLISSQHIGAEAVYCIKELPCNITKCFKIRDSEYAVLLVCSSIQQTEHCSISGTHIKLKCETQLHCFCNEEGPFELDEFPEIPVKDQSSISMENEVHPERNNTNRTESSGSSTTPLQIAFAVVGAVLAVLAVGAITCCVWKACRKQGHREPQLGGKDPQRQPLAQDQKEMELEDMNDASVEPSPRSVERQAQDASDGAAGRGAEDADGEGVIEIRNSEMRSEE